MSRAVVPEQDAAEFEKIEAALRETARGRSFLLEHARRGRQADTEMLLHAMSQLESVVRGERFAGVGRMRHGLADMANAIDRTKAEIAAIKPKLQHGRIEQATEELDIVMQATEAATSDILAASEQVQEAAQSLRQQGAPAALCDTLDARATDIFMACSFQDLTGQRTRKVIQLLRFLEARIDAMMAVWGDVDASKEPERPADQMLLNGPARPGEGLEQDDVDLVMNGPGKSQPNAHRVTSAAAAPDPLGPLAAMSYEEKVALFT
jgi:chemotaxis regulatin CheY-phosphate phosphatase CheZ